MITALAVVSVLALIVGILAGLVHASMWLFARGRAVDLRKRIFLAACGGWGVFVVGFGVFMMNPDYQKQVDKQNAERARQEQEAKLKQDTQRKAEEAQAQAEAKLAADKAAKQKQADDKKAAEAAKAAALRAGLEPGEYVIAHEYMATATEADLDTVTEYSIHKDANALAQLALQGRVIILKPGTHVYRVGSGGFLSGKVKIRPKGQTGTMWTVREAIAR